jgi:hypothetical protein
MSTQQTERDLLRLAAKAAGIKLVFDRYGSPRDCTGMWPEMNLLSAKFWNPLTDDGDALRLAVKLQMKVEGWFNGELECARADCKAALVSEPHNGDPYAATRRAITCAAAEIGKAMP